MAAVPWQGLVVLTSSETTLSDGHGCDAYDTPASLTEVDAKLVWWLAQLRQDEFHWLARSDGLDRARACAASRISSEHAAFLAFGGAADHLQLAVIRPSLAVVARCKPGTTVEVSWEAICKELQQCEHLALCVAAAANFRPDELLAAAQHRLVLPRLTAHVPRQHLRAWDPEVPDMETPALVTAVHVTDAENVGIDVRAGAQAISRLQKLFACATDATMAKHSVLWSGPLSGHPINLCSLWEPGPKPSDYRDHAWSCDARIWASGMAA